MATTTTPGKPPLVTSDRPAWRPTWPYWVVPPVCAMAYAAYCFWFIAEAWGHRGTPKPGSFDAAFVVAAPGMFFPLPLIGPLIGPLVVGGGCGVLFVWMSRWMRRKSANRG